jgi:TRAP-type uncharacterized transport system substrate-binding protein
LSRTIPSFRRRSTGGWPGGVFLRSIAAFICVVAAIWLALWYFIPAPPSTITIAAGIKGGAFSKIAEHYRERLARQHVRLNIRITGNAGAADLKAVEDPKSGVDAAFLFGGTSDSKQSPDLLSLGRISYAPMWIFYRGSETLERFTQLKGKRVAVNPGIPGLIARILAAHGVTSDNTKISIKLGPLAIEALKDGEVDVAILPPQQAHLPIMQPLWGDPELRLMNVTQAETLTHLFPNLNHVVLPQGAVDLERNISATDINLIATTNVVVVRKDLHPELIYLLAKTMQEEHAGAGIFNRAGEFPTQADPEYPMAEEAVDFYKNGPSFLQRYLPFWMLNYAKRVAAILVAAIAIVIPLFTYEPRLYSSLLNLRLVRLYRRLRVVNARLKNELTAGEVASLQTDLENIDRAANILPMRHSDVFFALLMHIDMTRTRFAARLAALQS